jgi:hypothetical protein
MSAESQVTESMVSRETTTRPWLAGIGGGLAGGVGMGLILQFLVGAMPLIGSLYGQPTVAAGWIAHLVHSVIFGLIFVALVTRTGLRRSARTTASTTALGTGYGIVLGVVTGGVVLPIWANAVAGAGMPVPFFAAAPFAGHVVFGLLLGVVFAITRGTGSSSMSTDARSDDATTAESTIDSN